MLSETACLATQYSAGWDGEQRRHSRNSGRRLHLVRFASRGELIGWRDDEMILHSRKDTE